MADRIVLAHLPKAGLGNKLYVFASASIFSSLNNVSLLVVGWTYPALGPFIRLEKSKRLYRYQFKHPPIYAYLVFALYLLSPGLFQHNPICNLTIPSNLQKLIVFRRDDSIDPSDSFKSFRPYRCLIKSRLLSILSPSLRKKLFTIAPSTVAIHVRRGDFSSTPWFTQMSYFCKRLSQIRDVASACLPATVFSDGFDKELAPLLDMPNVSRAAYNPEILDLLLLSQSLVLVTSPVSTFSQWAAFLSSGVVIRDNLFAHVTSRPLDINEVYFEGSPGDDVHDWPPLLVRNLRNLAAQEFAR